MEYKFGEIYTDKPMVDDTVQLQKGLPLPVVLCEETGVRMLNIDADEIQRGDLQFIKSLGLTISNPDTDRPIALGVDFLEDSWGERINDYLNNEDDDDDSDFFGGDDDDDDDSFLGGFGSGGFSGDSFGGFGGGLFSGGGASGDF